VSRRPAAPAGRSAELRLAQLHLRAGNYALARVELEALAGLNELDAEGILDLAEVRLRTGYLAGAAVAAATWLEDAPGASGPGAVLANVICAEASAARGDAEAAAAHVDKVAGIVDGSGLEALLAGIEPRAAWPWPAEVSLPEPAGRPPAADRDRGLARSGEVEPRDVPLAAAAADLVAAGAALIETAPERAAVLLALSLRADRAAAEAVLRALEASPTGGAAAAPSTAAPGGAESSAAVAALLAFVRAEALRAAGRHDAARIAYASAERLALPPAEAGQPGSPS
jgi:tetratricopeptide (TPR) repeat protein